MFVALGAVLRLIRFLHGRSLWHDESLLALNVVNRSYAELAQPLDNHQGSPLDFLWLSKWLISTLGVSELTLRAVPFLCGVFALVFTWLLARRCCGGVGVCVAVLLVATLESLVYYSAEFKHYSVDVCGAVAILWLSVVILQDGMRLRSWMALTFIGCIATWSSFGSMMVLAGVGTVVTVFFASQREWRNVALMALAIAAWSASFLAMYFLFLRDFVDSDHQQSWWNNYEAFMPVPPKSLNDVEWFVRSFFYFFVDPMGIKVMGLAAMLFTLGVWNQWERRRQVLIVLFAPVFVALICSALKKYPWSTSGRFAFPLFGRPILWVVPIAGILVGAGIEMLWRSLQSHRRMIAGIVLLFTVGLVCLDTARLAMRPPVMQDIRPLVTALENRLKPGDLVFVNNGSEHTVRFYCDQLGVAIPLTIAHPYLKNNLIIARGNPRVWVILSYIDDWKDDREEERIVEMLDAMGRRVSIESRPNANLYLYDMSASGLSSHFAPGQTAASGRHARRPPPIHPYWVY